MAIDNLRASGDLRRTRRYRSSTNRAYFAAYAAVTERLTQSGVSFAKNREGPPHGEPLRKLVKDHLPGLSKHHRREIRKHIHALYYSRLAADYLPSKQVGSRDVLESINNASLVLKYLGISP